MSATRSTIPRPSAAMLAFLYLELRWGCPDIAHLYERDGKTVFWWLRKAGIQTRRRGTNPAFQFKPGHTLNVGHKHTAETIAKVRAATIRDGRVPYLRNGQHWLKGQPPEANGRWAGGATPERQEFYRSVEWKAACRAVWKRANGCCERCSAKYRDLPAGTPTFHVHHIAPFAVRELRAEVNNRVLLCRPCHLFVHSNANAAREFLPAVSMPTLFVEEAEAA